MGTVSGVKLMMELNLTKKQQYWSIATLLLTTGLMWFGFFMLIPLLAVHITRDLGMTAAFAGLVLALRQITQFGLGLFAGLLSDYAGHRFMLMLGMLIRAAGFAWLAFAATELTLILAAMLAALGGASFEASSKAALAAVSKGFRRESIFSLATTVGNIGMSTGPLLGVALLKLDFAVVGVTAAAMYVINFLLILVFVPPIKPPANVRNQKPLAMFANLGIVWRNKPFVYITLLMCGYYALYSQINITLPLEATRLTNSQDSVAPLYVINSGLAITLSFVLLKILSRYFQPVTLIALGTGIAAFGLFAISFANSYVLMLLCVAVYSFGRLITEPVSAVVVTQYATDETLASYFGFGALALGIGGVIGNLMGGWLYDIGKATGNYSFCWWFFGGLGLVVVAGAALFFRLEPGWRKDSQNSRATGFETAAANPNHD
jgi:MFS transporter, DHA1 family, multidrug resistance protein